MKSGSIKKRAEVSSIMRFVGLLSVFAAGVSFMVQGWGELTDLKKYLTFFGFVGTLAGLSFLFQRQFKDHTTSRIFAVLSTLGVTTLFSQVGSILYSSLYPHANEVPSVFNLVVPLSDFTLMGILTALLTIPITLIGFESLIKTKAVASSLIFLTLNFIMLVPSRESGWTALFLLTQTTILCMGYKELNIQASISDRWNRLGFFSLMSAPIVTVMIRALCYSVDAYYMAMVYAVIGGILLFVPSPVADDEDPLLFQVQMAIGYGCWLLSWYIFSDKIMTWMSSESSLHYYERYLSAYVVFVGLALVSYAVYILKHRSIDFFKYGVIFFLNFAVLKSIAIHHNLFIHVVGLLLGGVLMAYSLQRGFKFLSLLSLASVIYSFSYYVDFVKYVYQLSPWLFFAITGVLLITVSAFYRRIADFMESLRIRHLPNQETSEPFRHQDL